MNIKILSSCFLVFSFFPLVIAHAVTTAPLSGAAIKSAPTASDVVLGTDTTTGQTRNFQLGKLSAVLDWSAWPNGSSFAANTMVAYQGQIYKCLQPYTKNSGDTPAAFTSYWSATGVTSYTALTDKPTIPAALADLSADTTHRVVTDAEKTTWNGKESALGAPATSDWCLKSNTSGVRAWGACGSFDASGSYSPTGTWDFTGATLTGVPKTSDFVTFSASSPLSFNPSTGALSMVPHSYQAYDANMITWPAAVSAAELTYAADGATSNLQAQINNLSVAGFSPIEVTTSPTTASATGTYINTANGHFYIVKSSGMLDISGAWTAAAITSEDLDYSADFESGAIPAGTSTSGTVSVSTSSPLAGIYSAQLVGSTSYIINTTAPVPTYGQITQRFIWRKTGNPASTSNLLVGMSTLGVLYKVEHLPNGTLQVTSEGLNPVVTSAIVANGDYKVWVTWDQTSQGLVNLYIANATATTRPVTPVATTSKGSAANTPLSFYRFYSGGIDTLIDNLSVTDNLTLN